MYVNIFTYIYIFIHSFIYLFIHKQMNIYIYIHWVGRNVEEFWFHESMNWTMALNQWTLNKCLDVDDGLLAKPLITR